MKCEFIAKEVLPVVRALLARNLLKKGLTQQEIARLLGTSQPAISLCKRYLRGAKKEIVESQKVREWVNRVSSQLAKGADLESRQEELCSLCQKLMQTRDEAFHQKSSSSRA